jgi:hypothetical protein
MALSNRWDPYDVWNRLLHDNPVSVEDPANSTGAMDASTARDFWASVADYPDPLQDALFVIAHARGFPAAIAALDQAIRDSLRAAEPRPARKDILPRHASPTPRTPDLEATDILYQDAFASQPR